MKANRIAVIGAGLIGVTTAYALARRGCEVTVFERTNGVALQASFAAQGLQSALALAPLTAHGRWTALLLSGVSRRSPLRLALPLQADRWVRPWLSTSFVPAHERLQDEWQLMLRESRGIQQDWRTSLEMEYQRVEGVWQLGSGGNEMAQALQKAERLRQYGVNAQWVAREELLEREPLLQDSKNISGALWSPGDESGNPRQFAQVLEQHAIGLGATFHYAHKVLDIASGPDVCVRYQPEGKEPAEQRFDACVVCAGADSAELAMRAGVTLTLMPLFLYSLTVPLRGDEFGPKAAMWDARREVAVIRLGNRLRLSGACQLGGAPQEMKQNAKRQLQATLDDWFPGQTTSAQSQYWMGRLAAFPDQAPLTGPSAVPGLWFNLGYGTHSWALCCAGAERIASQLAASA